MIEFSPIVACICEGGAETAIIDILIDNELLKFSRSNLLDEKVLRCRNGKEFEERYLRKGFKHKITVFRILDSHTEKFRLSIAYRDKVDVIKVITAPEIEMLLIIAEGMYDSYMKKNSTMKPSEYCKQILGMKGNIKSQEFIHKYFSDTDLLMKTLREYKRVKNMSQGEICIADLLK